MRFAHPRVLHTTTDRKWIGIESVIRTSMKISATRPPRPPLNRRYEDQPATAATTIIKPNTPSTAGVVRLGKLGFNSVRGRSQTVLLTLSRRAKTGVVQTFPALDRGMCLA